MSPLIVMVSAAVTVTVLAAIPPIYRVARRVRTRARIQAKLRRGIPLDYKDMLRIMEDL